LLQLVRVFRLLRKCRALVFAGRRTDFDLDLLRAVAHRQPATRHRTAAVATGGNSIHALDNTSCDEQRPRSVTRDDRSVSIELNNSKSGRKDKQNFERLLKPSVRNAGRVIGFALADRTVRDDSFAM
jgi:hypothetical protein